MTTTATRAVAPAAVGVGVGTVFVRSWGYDQTNVNFYRVVGLTPKGVKVQEWAAATVDDDGGPITHVVPGAGPRRVTEWPPADAAELNACRTCRRYADDQWGPGVSASAVRWCDEHGPREQDAPIKTARLSIYPGERARPYVTVTRYRDHAYLWDGTPMYETGAGWGH